MSDSQLKIKAESMDLELSGDPDYVEDAYEAMRSVVMERFYQTLVKRESAVADVRSNADEKMDPKGTDPHFQIDGLLQQVAAGRELIKARLQLVVCTDMYHRVAALSRNDFRKSIFGELFDPEILSKIYLSEEAGAQLKDQIEFGHTLWRELTKAGKAVVHGDSS